MHWVLKEIAKAVVCRLESYCKEGCSGITWWCGYWDFLSTLSGVFFPSHYYCNLIWGKKIQVFRLVLYFKDKSKHVKNSCRWHWGRSLMWKHYAALKKLLLFTNCRLKQIQHKVIQNKKFDGGKCEDNVSGKTRVIIESAQREKNVCKTF